MAEQVEMDEEIAIVGSGPIEPELEIALRRVGADHIRCDAHQIGRTIAWWPRGTQGFRTSERVAIAGIPIQSVHHQRITCKECLAYLRVIVEQYDLQIRAYEPWLTWSGKTEVSCCARGHGARNTPTGRDT
jgi:thioredoxin reductase (NADPH)